MTFDAGAPRDGSVQFGQDVADDLRGLMGGDGLAPLGFGDFVSEPSDRRLATDEDVAERLGAARRVIAQ